MTRHRHRDSSFRTGAHLARERRQRFVILFVKVKSKVALFSSDAGALPAAVSRHPRRILRHAPEPTIRRRGATAHSRSFHPRVIATTVTTTGVRKSARASHASSSLFEGARREAGRTGGWDGTRRAYRGAPPPGRGWDALGGSADGDRALWALIGLNGVVYYAWATTEDGRFMRKNFMVSEEALAHGRWHTMLTSAFSHFDLTHLGMNMIALYFFGRSVCERFGGRYLLTLYCVGGVGASAAHVAWCARQRRKRMERYKEGRGNFFDRLDAYVARFVEDSGAKRGYYFTPAALGASGAVNAIVAFEVLLYPLRTIYLYAIVPVPSILLGGLFLMRDIVGIQDSRGSGVAHAGHLGGAAVGALALAMLRTGGRRGRISM